MDRPRKEIEHDIWVAAYLTALRHGPPEVAEHCAIEASRRYQDRWDERYEKDSFDALSYRDTPWGF